MKLFYMPNFLVVTHLLPHNFKKLLCSYLWLQSFRKWCFPPNPPSDFCLAYGPWVAPPPWPSARCRMQGVTTGGVSAIRRRQDRMVDQGFRILLDIPGKSIILSHI